MKSKWLGVLGRLLAGTVVLGAAIAGYLSRDVWLPYVEQLRPGEPSGLELAAPHEHDEHRHAEDAAIVLTEQARKSLQLEIGSVAVTDHWRTLRIPATIVEWPGHTHRRVTAPLTGVVREIFVHPNQLVRPGDPLAELDLTGDALATAQAELLAIDRELELNQVELARIKPLTEAGSLPEKTRLELEYARKRLEVQLDAKSQALEVLGLSPTQIEELRKSRKLLRSFSVKIPGFSSEEKLHLGEPKSGSAKGTAADSPSGAASDWVYTVESIDIFPGKRVETGDSLCSLAFHVTLLLEGQAFEKESDAVTAAMTERWPVKAIFAMGDKPTVYEDLSILFVDNVVDATARTLRLYLAITNEILHDSRGARNEIYRTWRFKPGQRAILEIPFAKMTNVIVLPNDAIARDGVEAFAFRANGERLERQPVHVLYQSGDDVVIANDGSLFPGEWVARNHGYLINLAIERRRGEGSGHGHDHDH